MASVVKKSRDKCSNVCAVKFCKTTSQVPGASLFRFPKDTERCKQWVELCGCQYLLSSVQNLYSSMYRVCHLHFENVMFTCNEGKVKRLTAKSVPSTNLSKFQQIASIKSEFASPQVPVEAGISQSLMLLNPPSTRNTFKDLLVLSKPGSSGLRRKFEPSIKSPLKSSDVGSQTPTFFGGASTPRTQKLRSKTCSLKSKLTGFKRKIDDEEVKKSLVDTATLKDFKELCNKFLCSKCSMFVKLQADLHKKMSHQGRYTKKFLQKTRTRGFNAGE